MEKIFLHVNELCNTCSAESSFSGDVTVRIWTKHSLIRSEVTDLCLQSGSAHPEDFQSVTVWLVFPSLFFDERFTL